MTRRDRMKLLNARATILILILAIGLGHMVAESMRYQQKQVQREASLGWPEGMSGNADFVLAYGETVVGVASLASQCGQIFLLLLLALALGRSALARWRRHDPLAARYDLFSPVKELSCPDWRPAFLCGFAAFIVFAVARVWLDNTAPQGPALSKLSLASIPLGGLFFLVVGDRLYRRQSWGERFSREAERFFLARHAPDIHAHLREGEKIHEQAWLSRAHGGLQSSRGLLALVTNQRVIVVESILLGLDAIFRRSIPIGAVGSLGRRGRLWTLEIESLTEGWSFLEFVEAERRNAFFDAISRLRATGTAGVGALSIPEPNGAGGLSVAQLAGGLSERS